MALEPDALKKYIESVIHKVAPEADLSQIKPDKKLNRQLRIDSMDFVKILLLIHKEKGVGIPEEDYAKLTTFNQVLEYFQGRI
jgi:acyl carrier protein